MPEKLYLGISFSNYRKSKVKKKFWKKSENKQTKTYLYLVVKDSALSLLWFGLLLWLQISSWLRNFCMLWAQFHPQKTNKQKNPTYGEAKIKITSDFLKTVQARRE